MRPRRRALLGFVAAGVLLLAFLSATDWRTVLSQLAAARPGVFALGLVSSLVSLACWSEGNRRLVAAAGGPVPPGRFFVAFLGGTFNKLVLPFGHAGGPAIVAFAVGDEDRSYARTLAAITAAEGLSMIASFLLAVVGLAAFAVLAPPSPEVRALELAVGVTVAAFLGLAAVALARRGVVAAGLGAVAFALRATVGRVSGRVRAALAPDAVDDRLADFYGAFDAVAADRRAVLVAFLFGVLGWLYFSLPLYTGFLAIGAPLPPLLVFFVVPVSGLVATLPLPGGLGAVELALVGLIVALTGLPVPAATAGVLCYRAATYWFVLLVGAVGAASAAASADERPSRGAP